MTTTPCPSCGEKEHKEACRFLVAAKALATKWDEERYPDTMRDIADLLAKESREAKVKAERILIGILDLARGKQGEHTHTPSTHNGCGACITAEVNQRLENVRETLKDL